MKCRRSGRKDFQEVKIFQEMAEVEDVLRALISCIYLCFRRASGGDPLPLGDPMNRTIHPNDVAGEASCFEKW